MSLLLAGEEKYEQVSHIPINKRASFMEHEFPPDRKGGIETIKDVSPPRIVKTHLPYNFVNRWVERDEVKTIVSLRNPKDTLVSLYHFYKSNSGLYVFPLIYFVCLSISLYCITSP